MRPPVPAVDIHSFYPGTRSTYLTYHEVGKDFAGYTSGPTAESWGYADYHRDAFIRTTPSSSSSWRPPTAWNHRRCNWYWDTPPLRYKNANATLLPHQPPDFEHWVDTGQATFVGFPTTIYGTDDVSLENRTTSGALLKLQDQQVNLATNLVERKQTEELVADVLHKITASVKFFKRRHKADWDRLVRRSKDPSLYALSPKNSFDRRSVIERKFGKIPDKWLEVQYGWNPLMQDVQGAFQKIERREKDGLADRVTLTKTTISSNIRNIQVNDASFAKPAFKFVLRDATVSHTSLTYRMTNFPLAQFSSLGLLNPLYVIWEETPFSFVIDWFAPIGNILNSWTAAFGWTYMGGSYSNKITTLLLSDPQDGSHNFTSGGYDYSFSGSAVGSAEHFSRKVYGSSPLPGFYLKNPLSYLHASEALSLLIQVFR